MLITVLVVVDAVLFAASCVAVTLTVAARRTSTITLAGPLADRGELLILDEGGEYEETLVVRRVMPDLTAGHVVLVRPLRRWHRWQWTRRWL